MAQFFNTDTGPWGQFLRAKTQVVSERARQNASGPVIDSVTGELLASMQTKVDAKPTGAVGEVNANAIHRGWAYGGVVTRGVHGTGDPGGWLIEALTDLFPLTHT